MASNKDNSSEDSIDIEPYISDTRTYSDFILYFVNTGRFQHNSLMDRDRRKGVLKLLQSERVIKLTRDRRLSPVNVAMSPGARKQRVYLIGIVRSGKWNRKVGNEFPIDETMNRQFESDPCTFVSGVGQEQLDTLVDVMNEYIEAVPMDQREQAVVDLIFSTGSRIMPGIRYLPLHWYPTGAELPPDMILDEDNERIDGDGRPIINTDDETVAIVDAAPSVRRHRQDVRMPSTSAVLSDASTDSERGPGTYKKKRKVPPHEWPSTKVCFPVILTFTFVLNV